MEKRNLEIGDLVQLNPELVANKMFAACIMVITDPKEWGAQAYYRAKWEEMEYVGTAERVRA
ncbi:MAG: hypothetical protein WC055_01095 [Melioribacteraceae bacterium]